jgi:hypothetical protein
LQFIEAVANEGEQPGFVAYIPHRRKMRATSRGWLLLAA